MRNSDGKPPGRAETVPVVKAGKPDHRSGAEYAANLARETEASLRHSPSWRAGKPLADGERWPTISSAELGSRADRPDKGRCL